MTLSSRDWCTGSWPTKCTCIPHYKPVQLLCALKSSPREERILSDLNVFWLGMYHHLHVASSAPFEFWRIIIQIMDWVSYSCSEIIIKMQLQIYSNAWKAFPIALPSSGPLSALWTQRMSLPEPFPPWASFFFLDWCFSAQKVRWLTEFITELTHYLFSFSTSW